MRGRVPVGELARFSHVRAFGNQSHKTANEPRRMNMSKVDDKDLNKIAAGKVAVSGPDDPGGATPLTVDDDDGGGGGPDRDDIEGQPPAGGSTKPDLGG